MPQLWSKSWGDSSPPGEKAWAGSILKTHSGFHLVKRSVGISKYSNRYLLNRLWKRSYSWRISNGAVVNQELCGFVSLSGYPVSILSKYSLVRKVSLWCTHSLVLASSVSFGLDLNFNCFSTATAFKDVSAGSGVSLSLTMQDASWLFPLSSGQRRPSRGILGVLTRAADSED